MEHLDSDSGVDTYNLLPDDVIFGYQLILGREPESPEVVDVKRSHSTLGLFRDFLSSDEFCSSVYEPIVSGEQPREGLFPGRPDAEFPAWISNLVPLEAAAQDALGRPASWARALAIVLTDSEFQAWVGIGADTWQRPEFLQRLHRWAAGRGRRIVGHLDFVSSHFARGWALNANDVSERLTLLFSANGVLVGTCDTVMPRQDLAERYGGEGRHGFAIELDLEARCLPGHVAHLTVSDAASHVVLAQAEIRLDRQLHVDALSEVRAELARVGKMLADIERQLPDVSGSFSFPLDRYGHYYELFYSPKRSVRHTGLDAQLAWKPTVSVLVPVFESNLTFLEDAIRSVLQQRYDNWQLVLSDDGSSNGSEIEALVDRLRREARGGQEIILIRSEAQGGVSDATNRAMRRASGEYLAFLDHDDTLMPDALLCVVGELQRRDRPRIVYTDEDRISLDADGDILHHDPHMKPDFDPILLTQSNYICHFTVIEADLCREVGWFNSAFDGAQDYDYILRSVEHAGAACVAHVPRILYNWRVTAGSLSRDLGRAAAINERTQALVTAHLSRQGQPALVREHSEMFGARRDFTVRLRPSALVGTRATVIIPTRDRLDLLRPCVDAVLRTQATSEALIDIIVVDNGSVTPDCLVYLSDLEQLDAVTILRDPSPFNWAAINNNAAATVKGDVIVFLNNDTVALAVDWLDELCFWALRPDVGAVGARLVLADGRLQHAGAVLSQTKITIHEGYGLPAGDPGYLGRHHVAHSVSAVTGACLATRRSVFEQLGGFDAGNYPVICNDTDYCLRAQALGLRTVYTPHAVLYHFESLTRGTATDSPAAKRSVRAFRGRWRDSLSDDPYYNQHFERESAPFTRITSPRQGIVTQ